MKEVQAIVHALRAAPRSEFALATLVTVEGSSYRRPGARLLLSPDGIRLGSISGGCLEEDVLARAQGVLATGIAESTVYDTTSENDLVWGVGLGCHGVVRVVIEKLSGCPPWADTLAANFAARRPTSLAVVYQAAGKAPLGTRLQTDSPARIEAAGAFLQDVPPPAALFVFGAGDDARPLVRLAKELGWHVTVADPRAASATRTRFPDADVILTGPPDELVARSSPGPDAFAVVMTHHYVHDVPLIRALLSRPLGYLGLLGPRKRAEKILGDLAETGLDLTAQQRRQLHSPTGLDLGADAPEQVALAIIAEMHAVLTGRDARPLRDRARPIHS